MYIKSYTLIGRVIKRFRRLMEYYFVRKNWNILFYDVWSYNEPKFSCYRTVYNKTEAQVNRKANRVTYRLDEQGHTFGVNSIVVYAEVGRYDLANADYLGSGNQL